MKKTPFISLRNATLLICIILFSIQNVSAQYSRLTIDAKAGTNIFLGSVSPFPGINTTLGLRFSPSRLISVSAFWGTGVLWGNGIATKVSYSEIDNINTYSTEKYMFNTEYHTWGGNVYLNLQCLFNPINKPKKIITYLYTGAGFMRTRSSAESLETHGSVVRYMTYFTSNFGIEFKLKGTKRLDYLFCVQENLTETAYLDGIPFDGKFDNFISFSAGISYQICFNKNNNHIDWSRGHNCPYFRK